MSPKVLGPVLDATVVRNVTPVGVITAVSLKTTGTAEVFAVVSIVPGRLIRNPLLASTNLARHTNGEYNSIVKELEEGILRRTYK